jgi:hypothetical protein
MEVVVNVLEERLNSMDTTVLEANREKAEACLEETGAYLERKEPTLEEIRVCVQVSGSP